MCLNHTCLLVIVWVRNGCHFYALLDCLTSKFGLILSFVLTVLGNGFERSFIIKFFDGANFSRKFSSFSSQVLSSLMPKGQFTEFWPGFISYIAQSGPFHGQLLWSGSVFLCCTFLYVDQFSHFTIHSYELSYYWSKETTQLHIWLAVHKLNSKCVAKHDKLCKKWFGWSLVTGWICHLFSGLWT